MKIIETNGVTYADMLKNVRSKVFDHGNYDQLLVTRKNNGWSAKLYYGSEEITNMEFNNVIQAQANN